MKRIIGLAAALLGLTWATQSLAAPACAPEGQVRYLCGPKNVEDMVLAPQSRWIIASGMTSPDTPVGHLYAIDAQAKTFQVITPDVSGPAAPAYKACPGPPDLGKFAPHGLGLRPRPGARQTLYVVNHGGREAIEVFWLRVGPDGPSLTWIGCALLPDKGSGNGVAPLPGGGFVASKFEDAGDAKAFDKMASGQITGAAYAWRPGSGWRMLALSQMSGANGVEVTPDGRFILVNAWPEQRVLRFRADSDGAPVSIKTGFLPDNLRLAPGGKVFVAGQAGDIGRLLAGCGQPSCPHGWAVDELDPETMALTPVIRVRGTAAFGAATSALQVGDELWIGTYRGDRVAIVEVK